MYVCVCNEGSVHIHKILYTCYRYRICALPSAPTPPSFATCDFGPGKTFQKRSVSSPAPVTIVWPSGEMARYRTRSVCPVNVASFDMLGYRQTMIWFCEYPCVDTISFTFLLQTRLHTCEPVSTHPRGVLVTVFQKRMHRSAVPPPLASKPC